VWGRVWRRRSLVGLGEMRVVGKRREAEGRRLLPATRGGSGAPPPSLGSAAAMGGRGASCSG
jgi:hypothetical protein